MEGFLARHFPWARAMQGHMYDESDLYEQVQEAATYVKTAAKGATDVALILGSGLGGFVKHLENATEIPYAQIPHMPQTTVVGHSGKLIVGTVAGKRLLCFAGRFHAYEGKANRQLTIFPRLAYLCGCRLLIATNASGGAQTGMIPGCAMIMTDHLSLSRRNALSGLLDDPRWGPTHPIMTNIYSKRIGEIAKRAAASEQLPIFSGVYGLCTGPSYETPTEIQAGIKLQCSAFGMSTAPEAMTAHALGMEVFGLSLITNLASGISNTVLAHDEVLDIAQKTATKLQNVIKKIIADVELNPPTPPPTPCPHTPLHRRPVRFTYDTIKDSAEQLSRFLKYVPVCALVFADCHDTRFVSSLREKTELAYADLPGMPLLSVSGIKGKFTAGTTTGGSYVLCCHGHSSDGWEWNESVFVVKTLAAIGIKAILMTVSAGTPRTEDGRVGSLSLLKDVMNLGPVYPDHHCETGEPFHLCHPRLRETLMTVTPDLRDTTYLCFPGPSFPTTTEIAAARLWDFGAVGITNVVPVAVAASEGLEGCVLATITHEAGTSPVEATVEKVCKDLSDVLLGVVEKMGAHRPMGGVVVDRTKPIVWHEDEHLVSVNFQENFDHALESARYVSEKLGEAEVAVVVDGSIRSWEGQLVVESRLVCSEVPHFPSCAGAPGCILLGKLGGVPVLSLSGICSLGHGEYMPEITYGMRVLFALGVKTVYFLSQHTAVEPSLRAGDLVGVIDHANFTGKNPLFGPNDERMGKRFPDMSHAYDKDLLRDAHTCGDFVDVRSLFLGGSSNVSDAERHAAAVLGLQTIVADFVPNVIDAGHMGIKVGCFGFVARSESTQLLSRDNAESSLASLVAATIRKRHAHA